MKRLLVFLVALVATLALAGCGQGSEDTPTDAGSDAGDGQADDGPLGAGPYPVGTIEITITHPEAEAVTYQISCLGDTATLTPDVAGLVDASACLRLADPDVQGFLVDGPPADRVCTEIYGGPDEAAISGTINDQAINIVVTRNNGCGIDDWDGTLAGVLPTARGA